MKKSEHDCVLEFMPFLQKGMLGNLLLFQTALLTFNVFGYIFFGIVSKLIHDFFYDDEKNIFVRLSTFLIYQVPNFLREELGSKLILDRLDCTTID